MGCLEDLFLPSPSLSGFTSAEKQLIRLEGPARAKRGVRKVTWAELEGLRWLAEGGSCEVWSADLLGEPVAVKVLKKGLSGSEQARCSLAREAELLPLLSHRNILQLIGKGESEDGRPFLVLELLASVLADELPRPCVSMFAEPNEPDECTLCEFWSANPNPNPNPNPNTTGKIFQLCCEDYQKLNIVETTFKYLAAHICCVFPTC